MSQQPLSSPSSSAPHRLVLVENDLVEIMSIQHGITRLGWDVALHVARNGTEALALLRGTPTTPPLPRPYLLLMDLQMPQMSGGELLDVLRSDPTLADTVVFVYTTSDNPKDRQHAHANSVAGYITKDDDPASLDRMLQFLQRYFQTVTLPE